MRCPCRQQPRLSESPTCLRLHLPAPRFEGPVAPPITSGGYIIERLSPESPNAKYDPRTLSESVLGLGQMQGWVDPYGTAP